MTNGQADKYARVVDDLFCRPDALYGGFVRTGQPDVVAADVMVRADLHRQGDDTDRYELTLFDHIDGFAGELWERSAKTMLRLRPLRHPGLPEIHSAQFVKARQMGYTLTKQRGNYASLSELVAWAQKRPLEAFEQFSVLVDALRQLHGARIHHRGMLPGAFRRSWVGDSLQLSLSRFEMSNLITNVIAKVVRNDTLEVRETIREIYLTPSLSAEKDGPLYEAEHLTYLAPEMHSYIFGESQHSRREWDSTDIFGLGVLGWELCCGRLPELFEDQMNEILTSDGVQRARALQTVHEQMRTHLRTEADVPEKLRAILLRMLAPAPSDRGSSFELGRQLENNWDAIRTQWEVRPEHPYLVAFMPSQSDETIYRERRWISRSPTDAAGRDDLKAFFEEELRQAELIHSITGAKGYATGPDDVLADAEWVLIGTNALWFCAYLREDVTTTDGKQHEEILLIKYLRDHDQAKELFLTKPRRRVPAIDLMTFTPGDPVEHLLKNRPSWRPLAASVARHGQADPANQRFLDAMDFLLAYQHVELDARTYPFRLVEDRTRSRVLLEYDEERDSRWRHRSPLLMTYCSDESRRPRLGDFVARLEGERDENEDWIKLEIDVRSQQPSFGRQSLTAEYIGRRDANTIEVRMTGGAVPPTAGWLRPRSDSGTRPQLDRQLRARQSLQNQPGLISALRDPVTFDLGRRRVEPAPNQQHKGSGRKVIGDLVSLQPMYVLQGPPGSGKTYAATHALKEYLDQERGAKVLVSAQSNFALDNLGERLIEALPDAVIVREKATGAQEDVVALKVRPYLPEKVAGRMADEVRRKLTKRREACKEALLGPKEFTDEEMALAGEWLACVESNQVELTDRVRNSASIVLATCSIAATVLDGARQLTDFFDWVIVEEAAKAWPTELMVPLVLGARWTLIGDHRQIGAHRSQEMTNFLNSLAHTTSAEIKVHYAAREEYLRLLNLFATVFLSDRPEERTVVERGIGKLNRQFRMHSDIAEPVRRVFYPMEPPELDPEGLPLSFLESDESTLRPHGVHVPSFLTGKALIWLDTAGVQDCTDEPMWFNEGEVRLIDQLVGQMQPPPAPPGTEGDGSLAVLTPYRAQVQLLRQRGNLLNRVHTVHSFQGREADRVIVSLVRSSRSGETPMSNVGHVGQDEVANVLLSRARRLMVLVGNFGHFSQAGGPNWRLLTTIIQRYGKVVPVGEWSDV